MKTQNSHLFSQLKALFHQTLKTFISSNSMRLTHSRWIAKTHFHLNLMRYLSESIETCLLMILHENIIIWIHVHYFQFLVEISPPTHNIGCSACFSSCKFKHLLNSDSHEKWKSSRQILKIHIQDSRNFSTLLIFKLSSCDSSPSLITSRWWIFES